MGANEDLGRDDKLLYAVDITLLPDEVRAALDALQVALEDNTDYLHSQVTFDDLRTPRCVPDVQVIVDKI